MAKSKEHSSIKQPFIVRRGRVRDDLNRRRMVAKIAPLVEEDVDLSNEVWIFLNAVSRTEFLEGYDLPSPDDSAEQIMSKFEAYLDMESQLAEDWKAAVAEANKPIGHGKFAPPEHLTKEEKKDSPTNEKNSES